MLASDRSSAVRGLRRPKFSPGTFRMNAFSRQMWRLGDCVIACLVLALTAPLMPIAAVMIKLESAGPVLERRECIGRGGRRFQRLRFRTTTHDPRHATPA